VVFLCVAGADDNCITDICIYVVYHLLILILFHDYFVISLYLFRVVVVIIVVVDKVDGVFIDTPAAVRRCTSYYRPV